MAHLLEQQHILRREFTSGSIPSQQPNNLINGGENNCNNNILRGSQSNSSSSLSPSMEQVN
jgi:hypothetical protein